MYISRPEPPQSGVPMKVFTSKVFSKAEPLYMSGMYSQTSADKCLTWRKCDQDGAGQSSHGAGGGTDGAGRFFSDVPAPRICLLRPPVAQVRIFFRTCAKRGVICAKRGLSCAKRSVTCAGQKASVRKHLTFPGRGIILYIPGMCTPGIQMGKPKNNVSL